jgi:hypothetical protein
MTRVVLRTLDPLETALGSALETFSGDSRKIDRWVTLREARALRALGLLDRANQLSREGSIVLGVLRGEG